MDFVATVLGAIYPDGKDAFIWARDHLPSKYFDADAHTQKMWDFTSHFLDSKGTMPTVTVMESFFEHVYDAGTAAYMLQKYKAYCALVVEWAEFQYAVEMLVDAAQKNRTGEIIATAYEILEQGYVVDGEKLEGHEKAREFLSRKVSELDKDLIQASVPEGDVLSEADQILADYKKAKENSSDGIIPTYFPSLDSTIGGFRKGDLVLIASFTGSGKASPLSTPVLTPSGWKCIGDLSVGDAVCGSDGQPQEVLQVHDRGVKDVYRVTMHDGGSVLVAGDHLWTWQDQNHRLGRVSNPGWKVDDTRTLVERVNNPINRVYLPVLSNPIEFEQQGSLPIHPYVVGALLGDGHTTKHPSLTSYDKHILDKCYSLSPEVIAKEFGSNTKNRYSFSSTEHGTFARLLRAEGLMGHRAYEKSIPEKYKKSSAEDRLHLLQGLMDTDGWVEKRGAACFGSTSKQLAEDVAFVAQSLGAVVHWHSTKKTSYVKPDGVRVGCRDFYRFRLVMPEGMIPVSLPRKVERFINPPDRVRPAELPNRRVKSIEYVGDEEVRCISVSNEDSLYVTEDFILTHNSQTCVNWSYTASIVNGSNVFYATTETTRIQIRSRFLARHSRQSQFNCDGGLDHSMITRGALNEKHEKVLENVLEDLSTNPAYGKFHIAQLPSHPTLSYIEQRMLREQQSWNIDMLTIDSLNLLRPEVKRTSQREELVNILTSAQSFSSSYNGKGVVLLSPWQINRDGYEKAKTSRTYELTGLAESSEAEKSADIIFSLFYDAEESTREATLQTLKTRGTATPKPITLEVDYRNSFLTESKNGGKSSAVQSSAPSSLSGLIS